MTTPITPNGSSSRILVTPKKKVLNFQKASENGMPSSLDSDAPCPDAPRVRKSKVGEYIREMQGRQEVSRARASEKRQQDLTLSLEDLYLGDQSTETAAELSPETTKRELRKSLRILKEKDMVIMSLREACQDLSLKCADAENTIDEMRFRGGQSSMRRSQSEVQVSKVEKGTKDQATETTVDVLSECCSSWMEKVKYWKTDSMFNASADADSGFRGSDLAEHEIPPRRRKGKTFPLLVPSAQVTIPQKSEDEIKTTTDAKRASSNLIPLQRRSRSQTNLNWPTAHTNQKKVTFDQFESLDKLLDEATAHARRVHKKSQRLSQLIQSSDKKV